MKKTSLVPKGLSDIIVVALTSVCAVAATAIVTHYPGVIGIRFQAGTHSGHVVIDGRTSSQPTLPLQK